MFISYVWNCHLSVSLSPPPSFPQWLPILLYQGVKAVIAKSFERIHRSNLVGMGIIPLCFKTGEDADTLGLTAHERYTIDLPSKVSELKPGQDVTVTTDNGKSFTCTARFDTEVCDTDFCLYSAHILLSLFDKTLHLSFL